MRILLILLATASLVACQSAEKAEPAADDAAPTTATTATETTDSGSGLAAILAAQPDDVQARYAYRHPQQTLEFFGVEPGMTVLEALPGGGWYSKVLIPYLGTDGQLIGADYDIAMYPLFGFFDEEFVNKKKTWVADWTAEAAAWNIADGAPVSAFVFGSMPDSLDGSADVVLFIRALHNLNRFEEHGAYLTTAISEAFRALKPGGILGVVQHHARDDKSDVFALGDHGYLKKSAVISHMESAGFELLGEIDVNANPADQPGDDDIVWRLPPTLMGSEDNPEARAAVQAVGESNRMTLKFRKPE